MDLQAKNRGSIQLHKIYLRIAFSISVLTLLLDFFVDEFMMESAYKSILKSIHFLVFKSKIQFVIAIANSERRKYRFQKKTKTMALTRAMTLKEIPFEFINDLLKRFEYKRIRVYLMNFVEQVPWFSVLMRRICVQK